MNTNDRIQETLDWLSGNQAIRLSRKGSTDVSSKLDLLSRLAMEHGHIEPHLHEMTADALEAHGRNDEAGFHRFMSKWHPHAEGMKNGSAFIRPREEFEKIGLKNPNQKYFEMAGEKFDDLLRDHETKKESMNESRQVNPVNGKTIFRPGEKDQKKELLDKIDHYAHHSAVAKSASDYIEQVVNHWNLSQTEGT